MPSPRKHIALFGGSFNPVHDGHVHMAGLAQAALGLDEVRFIPCRISPHKPGTPPAPAADRVAMLRLALEGIPWAVIDPYELENPGPSFSYLTAGQMAGRFPDARLFWIMGGDQWESLPKWRHPERLAAMVEFIVIARGKGVEERPRFTLHVVDGAHPASSSAVRRSVETGQEPLWIRPSVADHIRRAGLYPPPPGKIL